MKLDNESNKFTRQPEKPIVSIQPTEDMHHYITCAADSIAQLRKTDVFRVLVETNRSELRARIASYIKENRPDLVREVDEVLAECAA